MMKVAQRAILLGLIVVLINQVTLAQDPILLDKKNACSYSEELEETGEPEYYIDFPSDQAEKVLNEILKAASLDDVNFELKVSNVKNAVATTENGKRYILYSQQFISQAIYSTQNKWVVYSILAHEVGHHVLGHDFKETNSLKRKKMELEADKFSARLLRVLCAQEEDVVAAISTLEGKELSPNYPPVSARKEVIADSWYRKDAELIKEGRDPCNIPIPLNFGNEYRKQNLSDRAKGLVKEDRMVITFDSKPKAGKFDYSSYLVTSRQSNLVPTSMEWISDPTRPGKNRQLIWYYKKDGYTKAQVQKSNELGVAVFEARRVPKPVKPVGFFPEVGVIALGVASIIKGGQVKTEALDTYDNIYAIYRNPSNSVYQDGNPSRTSVYIDANDKFHTSQGFRNTGYALIAVGTALLVRKIIKHRRGRIGKLYAGDGKVKFDPESLY